MSLNRDTILNAQDITTETVAVPEWGGSVNVRAMNGAERDAYEASAFDLSDPTKPKMTMRNARAKLCAICIVDEHGKRMFSDKDVELLSRKGAAALDRVFAVAQRLSGLSKKDMDELGKNSEAGQSESSPSDSPAT